mgnify:CR=1 FL=1
MNTSYFTRMKEIPLHSRVAISHSVPKWYRGRRYMPLAPTREMIALAKMGREGDYALQYIAHILKKLDPEQVITDLGTDTTLLCWEAPGKFCHRYMVARWLNNWLGIDVPEMAESDVDVILPSGYARSVMRFYCPKYGSWFQGDHCKKCDCGGKDVTTYWAWDDELQGYVKKEME